MSSTKNFKKARASLYSSTSDIVVEVLAIQMDRAEEAHRRIEEEGIVVRDLKGSVIPHPAIKIEIDAGKIISDLIKKH
jgi:hypothetical protein